MTSEHNIRCHCHIGLLIPRPHNAIIATVDGYRSLDLLWNGANLHRRLRPRKIATLFGACLTPSSSLQVRMTHNGQ